MISNILDTSTKMTHKANNNEEGMVLIWSRHDDYNYEYEYDFKSQTNNNNKEITWISIESNIIDKKFFSGRNLENLITNLQNDS